MSEELPVVRLRPEGKIIWGGSFVERLGVGFCESLDGLRECLASGDSARSREVRKGLGDPSGVFDDFSPSATLRLLLGVWGVGEGEGDAVGEGRWDTEALFGAFRSDFLDGLGNPEGVTFIALERSTFLDFRGRGLMGREVLSMKAFSMSESLDLGSGFWSPLSSSDELSRLRVPCRGGKGGSLGFSTSWDFGRYLGKAEEAPEPRGRRPVPTVLLMTVGLGTRVGWSIEGRSSCMDARFRVTVFTNSGDSFRGADF